MTSNLNLEEVERLQTFIEACRKNPQVLFFPQLKFFRDYLEGLGCTLPKEEPSMQSSDETTEPKVSADPPPQEEPPQKAESEESDVELDLEGVVKPEELDAPELGDSSKVVSEDDEVAAGEKRSEAMMALSEGEMDKAIVLLTEAIKINPSSAMLYAKRASILLKQNRVKAALRDCDEAVSLNPDSASAHKFRGRAHRLLGNWLQAAQDLRLACRLDFDEQANEWLKELLPNVSKLEEHQRKYERKRQEKDLRERKDRMKKTQEEAKEKSKKESCSHEAEEDKGGLGDFFNDPEILIAMKDPEVAQAFQDVSANPANILKYQNNPKVSKVINKLLSKFGGGMPGGFPGGAGGAPGGFPGGFPGGAPGGFPGGFPAGMDFSNGMPSGFPDFGSSDKDKTSSSESKNPADDLD